MKSLIALGILTVLLVGAIFLQVILSKKQNKWFGLILPILCFVFSIISIVGFAGFNTVTQTSTATTYVSGETGYRLEPNKQDTIIEQNHSSVLPVILGCVPLLLICNIPTVILLCIYFGCRENIKMNKDIDKMKIQDL